MSKEHAGVSEWNNISSKWLPHLDRAVDNLKLQLGDIKMMTHTPVDKYRGWIDDGHTDIQINCLGEWLVRALEDPVLQQVGRK